MKTQRTIFIVLACLGLGSPVKAASTTSAGEISIAQVADLIQRSAADNAARNAAIAYLAGVGEATGLLIKEAGGRATGSITCARPLGISSESALAALSRTDKDKWGETAATPILVGDMLARASCH